MKLITDIHSKSATLLMRHHVPQGLKDYPVYLWSPSGKNYGLWSMARAERICRQQLFWCWTVKCVRPQLYQFMMQLLKMEMLIIGLAMFPLIDTKKEKSNKFWTIGNVRSCEE